MLIKVKVRPSSKKEQIIQNSSDSFEISVREAPIDGQATQRVRKILADFFGIVTNKVRLKKGGKKRNKIFEINN
ncbi:MAG: DUF167 domain-containing protein [Candidatus Portnoybacteria bacterium]|nr:DUF167 domain-containing protein [Candidatus Portnoybacteria bacterium]